MDYKLVKPYIIEFLTLLITVIVVRLFLNYFGIGRSTMNWKDILSWEYIAGIFMGYIIILIVRYLYRAITHKN